MPVSDWIGRFIKHESAGGIILMLVAVLALLMSNSPVAWLYDGFIDTPVAVEIGALKLRKPLLLWINDGLMAIFFFLVGLEIKREVLEGRLASREEAMLPGIAAFGGMLVPALVYCAVAWKEPGALDGWAIPAATDIAFALGVLSLLGSRVPIGLKVFLLALAIIDDLGAILIIAIFFAGKLSGLALVLAAIASLVLFALNRAKVARATPFVITGVLLWVFVLKSGVHATLAGAITALAIPLRGGGDEHHSLFHKLEETIEPWVAFAIMPLFAFANSGVSLAGVSLAKLLSPIPLAIALGLIVGKPVGIIGFSWMATRLGISKLPEGVTWPQMIGLGLLGGVGFTMSLLIGTLAFPEPEHAVGLRLGVLTGSVCAALLGYAVLKTVLPREAPSEAATG
ncbi:MAG: Na+/H+ antiporter NhaA [Hyphomicrobiaceae bacterium]|nr:MAG: Na+/H+ antiporter NhaA [Hyphomicrobiaceae bacterium]